MATEIKVLGESPESLIGKVFEYSWKITAERNGLYVFTGRYDGIAGKVTGVRPDGKIEFEITKADIGYPTIIDNKSGWGYDYPLGKTHAFSEETIRDAIAGKYKIPKETSQIVHSNEREVAALLRKKTPSAE